MAQKETFRTLIAKNCRNSNILMGLMVLLFVGTGALFGEALIANYLAGIVVGGIIAVILLLFAFAGGESAIMSVNNAEEISTAVLWFTDNVNTESIPQNGDYFTK